MNLSASSSYVADILSQPCALRAVRPADVAAAAGSIARRVGSYPRVVLTGMGASHAALRPLWLLLVRQGCSAWLLEAAEMLGSFLPLIDESTLVIVASQSGRSAEVLALAEEVRARGATLLAITNDVASDLATRSHAVIDIAAGPENAVSTKTYVNTLAAAALFGRLCSGVAGGEGFGRSADAIDGYLADWRARVDALKDGVGLPGRLYYVARGASCAAAECGALIMKEAAKWPAEADSVAQFRHGPLELADGRLTVVILAGEDSGHRDLNRTFEGDLRRYGARAFWLDVEASHPAFSIPALAGDTRPMAEILPLQLLTIAVAEQTGVEAGAFRHLAKVTTVL